MAFPQDGAPVETQFAHSGTTSHAVTMPATLVAGDLIEVFISLCGVAASGLTITVPSGWTEKFFYSNTTPASVDMGTGVYVKISDGTEDGSTVDFVSNMDAWGCAFSVRVTAASWFGDLAGVEAGTVAAATGTAVGFNSLTPSWGALDTLFQAFAGWVDDAETATGFPSTNYENGDTAITGGSNTGHGIGYCSRELNASSEDPGDWTLSASENISAVVVAIRPAANGSFANPFALLGVGRAA